MIVIVDFGMGNLRSIQYKLSRMGIEAMVTSRPGDVEKAEKLILPGVGHFAKAMSNLRDYGLISVLNSRVLAQGTPVLGICLGMQLFTMASEEGSVEGLGWIDAETKRFRFEEPNCHLPVPHVGWNTIHPKHPSPILAGVTAKQRFYFTHSYCVHCASLEDVLATTTYGHEFVSVIQKDNIYGTQFHPEKSHKRGIELIGNFVRCG